MPHRIKLRWSIAEVLFALLALVPLVAYTHVQLSLFDATLGFEVWMPNNEITRVSNQPGSTPNLEVGDRILSINGVGWQEILDQKRNPLGGYQTGDQILLVIQRGEQSLTINWLVPKIDEQEVGFRIEIYSWLILPIVFWIFGVLSFALIRPRNRQRNLFSALCFITGIWLAAGFISSLHIWYSYEVFHLGVWLTLPAATQLCWEFPSPLKKLSNTFWWGLWLICGIAGLMDFFGYLPQRTWIIVGMVTILGSIVLLVLHYIWQPHLRRTINLLIAGFLAAMLPALVYMMTLITPQNPLHTELFLSIAYWSLFLLPATFFYAIYHRKIGQLELRINQAISFIIYFILLFSLTYIGITAYIILISVDQTTISGSQVVLICMLAGLFSAAVYPKFQDWFSRKVLGIPTAHPDLFESYSERIATTIDTSELVELLSEQIFPSLMIRQAALLQLDRGDPFSNPGQLTTILTLMVNSNDLPSLDQITALLNRSGKYIPHLTDLNAPAPWAKVVLPLRIEERLVGICLLGRRDPDDYYGPAELTSLKALMNMTALALVHIDQTRLMRALLQDDINRQENERSHLALALHDQVLGQMAILAQSVGDSPGNDSFWDAYQQSVQQIREIISGLRPPLLNFGLRSALEGLEDDLVPFSDNGLAVDILLPNAEHRYPAEVDMHIYRIIQEACVNAVQHGKADRISISGLLNPTTIDLTIADDGIGFVSNEVSSLSHLISHQHFGLAGMHERAALIGGRLRIETEPGRGTRVQIFWSSNHQDALQDLPSDHHPKLTTSNSARRQDIS